MLVLGRKEGDWIQVGDAKVFILHASSGRVSVGIEAGREVHVVRGELIEREQREKGAA